MAKLHPSLAKLGESLCLAIRGPHHSTSHPISFPLPRLEQEAATAPLVNGDGYKPHDGDSAEERGAGASRDRPSSSALSPAATAAVLGIVVVVASRDCRRRPRRPQPRRWGMKGAAVREERGRPARNGSARCSLPARCCLCSPLAAVPWPASRTHESPPPSTAALHGPPPVSRRRHRREVEGRKKGNYGEWGKKGSIGCHIGPICHIPMMEIVDGESVIGPICHILVMEIVDGEAVGVNHGLTCQIRWRVGQIDI